MMNKELKPCPFCGGEAMLDTRRVEDSTSYGVMCFTPGCCALNTIYPTEEMAIQAWNRRTTDE